SVKIATSIEKLNEHLLGDWVKIPGNFNKYIMRAFNEREVRDSVPPSVCSELCSWLIQAVVDKSYEYFLSKKTIPKDAKQHFKNYFYKSFNYSCVLIYAYQGIISE